jgi:beta-N-acetylhexosaminidase
MDKPAGFRVDKKRISIGAALLVAMTALPATPRVSAATPTTAQLVGQKLMVAMSGTMPSAALLARVERGEVGGVILFGANITSAGQLASLTAKLRAAATAGGQPPLLIATDQEGGAVKRVSWAPPTLAPPEMGALGSSSTAYNQGKSTGIVLGCAGINTNLAPVADVPSSTSSFMYQAGRTWSFNASTTATLSDAFARGLVAGMEVPAMKHFPGIGFAAETTDRNVVTITASASALAPGLTPYQKAIGHAIPMIMLSNATYTAYDTANGAGWSHAISVGLLRSTLGFTGVSITDSLNGTAAARGVTATSLAIKAAAAGTDMILLSGSESATASAYVSLVNSAENGTIPRAALEASYARIQTLKAGLAVPAADTNAPSLAVPVSHLYSISTLGSTTVPVRTAWSATDGCGVSRYTLQRQVAGGAWTAQALTSGSSGAIVQSLTIGSTYRYRVQATDGAGNVSAWRYGPAFRPLLTQQSSTAVHYAGTWHTGSSTSPSGGSVAYSTATGASATYTFTGVAVAWVAPRGPARGSAAVYIDGVYKGTVSLFAPSFVARQIVYATHWSGNGSHTFRIVNLGTAGHSRVDVDGFVRLIEL